MEEKETTKVLKERGSPVVRAFDLSTEGRVLSSFSDETIELMTKESGSKLIPAIVTDVREKLDKNPDLAAFHIDWSLSWGIRSGD